MGYCRISSVKYGAVLDLRPLPCSLFLVSAMSLPAEHLCCSSYASSDTEGGSTRRLTAAQELHGHVEDCLSLYDSRFVHAPTSLAAIQRVVPPPLNNASCTDGEAAEEDDGEGGVDESTVATVVWLRDGVRAATPDVPLGVLLTFQYWEGFRVCAERTYVSLADAETAAASLANASQWSPEDLMRADGGWKRIADEGGDETVADGGGVDPEAHLPSYESLMALLVHRYL